MPQSLLARCAVALLAGVAMSAAFEPVAAPWLIPLAIAGLVFATRDLRIRRAWVPGFVFGLGFQFSLLVWMRAIGPDAYVALSLVEAAYFAPLGMLFAILGRLRFWPLWSAAAWVAVEQWRSSWPFGGLPWGRLAFASIDSPLAPWLPYVGSTGTSLIWALLGTTLAWAILQLRSHPVRALVVSGGMAVLVLLPTLVPYAVGGSGTVTVAAVQGDVPGDGTNVLYDHRQVTANHVDATVQLAADARAGLVPMPDFVVWPENSTAVDPFTDEGVNSAIRTASAAIGVPILVGGIAQGAAPDEVLNQGIVWHPETGGGDRYTKRHPVAYGEYIPFREQLPFTANFGRLTEIERDMLAGTRQQPLDIAGIQVGDAICFDVAYDDGIYDQVRAGSDLLVVQTSNAMFVKTSQLEQQFAISRVRAIETGKHVVVAATNGITGIIDDQGRVIKRAEIRTQQSVVAEISLTPGVPPGVRLGPVIGWLCVLVTAFGVVFAGALGRLRVGDARVSSSL